MNGTSPSFFMCCSLNSIHAPGVRRLRFTRRTGGCELTNLFSLPSVLAQSESACGSSLVFAATHETAMRTETHLSSLAAAQSKLRLGKAKSEFTFRSDVLP